MPDLVEVRLLPKLKRLKPRDQIISSTFSVRLDPYWGNSVVDRHDVVRRGSAYFSYTNTKREPYKPAILDSWSESA